MVHYIFSDKTGTLTQNVMEFKRFSVGPHEYGSDSPAEQQYPPGITNVNFSDPKFKQHLNDPNDEENSQRLERFCEAVGLCHTVISDIKVDENG